MRFYNLYRTICYEKLKFAWIFRNSWPKMVFWGGKMGEGMVRCWPQRTRFYFWGFLLLCQFWWKLINKCDRESAHRRIHRSYITLIYAKRRNCRAFKEIGSRNTMVTSDFRPEVEIWPFRACAMKICNITIIIGQFSHCGLGYGADTSFHKTYF